MQRVTATVLEHETIAEGYFRLAFSLPKGSEPPMPGQFMTMRISDGISPLLRRPFAYASGNHLESQASILYERRGSATQLMTAYRPGDELDLLGPLGNAFPAPAKGFRPVLVAGGIGIGPMLFLWERLTADGLNPILLTGARFARKIPTGVLPPGTIVCTDDGSAGFHGTVVQALEQLTEINPDSLELFICGPHGMMKAIVDWCSRTTITAEPIPCWVSMEQTMACAVGACMGCVVKINHTKQFARVCTEGPIFRAEYLDWTR